MRLPAIKDQVTRRVGRQMLIAQKNSPTILFAVGAVGLVTTVVLASKATLRLDEVIGEAEARKNQIDEAQEIGGDKYTDEDAKHDGVIVRTQTALKIAKLYAPATVVGLVTIGAFTGQHVILSRRNAALSAAYAAVDIGFKEYRKRVVDEFGVGKDREFRAGTMVVEQAVDTDDGTAVKTVKATAPSGPDGYSMYAKCFDQFNPNWQKTPHYNQMFLNSQQNYANELLNAKGHISLNDVYDMLGFERTKAGYMVGWVKGSKTGDGFVDFGIADTYEGQRFIKGDERSVFLDFNVDGVILDLI